MVATPRLSTAVAAAERTVLAELTAAERLFAETFSVVTEATRSRSRETLEESGLQREARENIERLQLRLELLRNIRMNWNGFQKRMTAAGMTMRINQDAHLRHLVSFLETGKGVLLPGEDALEEEIDPRRSMMTHEVQPTGAGKTGAFAIDIALMGVPSLTLVPLDPLLGQTKKDMVKIGGIPEHDIGIVGGGTKDFGDKRHIVATYAGHMAMMRKGGPYAKFMKTKCKLVICDEVHYQALGDSTQASIQDIDDDAGLINGDRTEEEEEMIDAEREVLAHLEDETAVQSLKIGFTATPRGAKKHVRQYFPQCLGRVYHRQMIEAGSVVPYKIIHCDGTIYEGDMEGYMSEEKEAEIHQRERTYEKLAGEYAEALATYRKVKRSKTDYPLRGMTFCTNHDECEKFVKEAAKFGLRCSIVTGKEAYGKNSQKVIDEAMDALNADEIDLVVTVEKLAVGFNRPEINSIVWARLTSAAKTIQCVGRGGRAHTDDLGRVKEECLVFETNWTLQKKKGRRPMRLTDALAFNGEEPEAICSMADGSSLDTEYLLQLKENGTVVINDRVAISASKYSQFHDSEMGEGTLLRYIKEAGIQPIAKKRALSRTVVTDLYWEDEVKPLMPKRIDSQGIATIEGRDVIAVYAYVAAQKIKIMESTLLRYIDQAGLKPVPNVKVLNGSTPVEVYWKSEIDPLLPKYLDEKGIVSIDGRDAVGLSPYAEALEPSIHAKVILRCVAEAQLLPVPNVKVMSGEKPIQVYWKSEVDPLLPLRLSSEGITTHEGTDVVAISIYTAGILDRRTVEKDLEKKGIQPIAGVKAINRSKYVDVYRREHVDSVLAERGQSWSSKA